MKLYRDIPCLKSTICITIISNVGKGRAVLRIFRQTDKSKNSFHQTNLSKKKPIIYNKRNNSFAIYLHDALRIHNFKLPNLDRSAATLPGTG